MRYRSSAWLAVAVGVTVLGLVIGPARETGSGDRGAASFRPPAAVIVTRAASAISAAAADSVLQVIVTTPDGVIREVIDNPGHVTELVRNRAGGTLSENAIRELPGAPRRYESRAIDFVAGTWSQMVLADTPGGSRIESPAAAITARLHHQLGPGGHPRIIRATTIDGEPVYVIALTGPGGPPDTVWISRSSWLPVQSASPGMSVGYEWTAPGSISAASLWPGILPGLARIPRRNDHSARDGHTRGVPGTGPVTQRLAGHRAAQATPVPGVP